MFGKRPSSGASAIRPADAPAQGAAAIPTRPMRVEIETGPATRAIEAAGAPTPMPSPAGMLATPKPTMAYDQLKAAQGPASALPEQSEYYHATKTTIFTALINTIDLGQLANLDHQTASDEIRDIVAELVAIKNVSMSVAEQDMLVQDIINDVLGYGPLEPLLARDDISDIMVNGAARVFIEVAGKVQLTNVRFRDNTQLMNICQRIVSQVGRRVDESSPICPWPWTGRP